MADPLSIIGTAGAIANIIDVLTKTISTVCDMRQAWKVADLAVFAFENQLNLLKLALFEIQKWTESRSSEQSHQLVMQVDSCVTCCRLLIGKIDSEVSQFQKTAAGGLELGSRLSFLFKTKDMEQIQRMVDQQTHTLTLLLSACNSNALEEQTRILQQPKIIQALEDMDRDTASLIVHRDSDSIITATSVSSSRWPVQFAFDRELFITKVYDKWIRKLATARRSNSHRSKDTTQQDNQQISNNDATFSSASTDEQQTTLVHAETTTSEEVIRSSASLGEQMNSLTETAVDIYMQPLKRGRARSRLKLQTKNSQRIDQNLKDDSKSTNREVKVVILGSKSRKRVFEEMRLSDYQPQCYTTEQLRMFRPIILGIVLEGIQYLAKRLLADKTTRGGTIRACLEDVLICDKYLDLNNGFEPWVVEIFHTIMSHSAAKALMTDETFVLPENADYFLNQIDRIMQDNYIPTDSDAINCPTPLPGCVEAIFNMGQLTMRLTDPGNATVNRTKLFPQLEAVSAVIYVFDLSTFSREALLQYELTVDSRWLRNSFTIVILNNSKGFAKRLAEEPLSDEFPDYAGGDDERNASKYILSKISVLDQSDGRLYIHFTNAVYDDGDLERIWRFIQDAIVERALKTLLPKKSSIPKHLPFQLVIQSKMAEFSPGNDSPWVVPKWKCFAENLPQQDLTYHEGCFSKKATKAVNGLTPKRFPGARTHDPFNFEDIRINQLYTFLLSIGFYDFQFIISKESLSNSPSHVEETDPTPQAETAIEYDSNGLSGIIRSLYVLGAATLASLGGFSFGYDQGVISIILTMKQFHDQFPETAPDHPRYGFNVGFMTGMLELGAFVGCLFLPYLADRISRKWAMTVATVFFTIGAVIQTASHNYGTLVAGRAIGGIGVGTLAMGAPLYISEISPPNLRGSLLVLEALSIVIGAIISYWITYGTKDMASEWSFRLSFLLQMPPALLVGLGIHFFPYSPRWLVMRQRDDDSLHALAQLRRVPATDDRVQAEWKGVLTEIRFQQEILSQEHPNDKGIILELKQWGDLSRSRCLKRTAVALGIPFFQQFSGINAFVYYAPTFFKALGQDDNMALILSGMVNICQLAAGIPTCLYLDKMGRRKLAILGGAAMAVPHLIMSGVVGKFDGRWEANPGMGWFGVALIYIYVLCYACSYGPLAWTLPAEVFPSSLRAKGVGAATAMVWLANFIIGVVVPEMIIKIG
ncbi:GNA-3 g alpha subunit GNA-3 [Fusarium subglutinans]|uniref:GNA-3 g alpha subunit GNA-3 n=1 Tax=Gibberella subglutinans TaxID=42677 RepID=A0A8H5QAV7_GIBSU|nr:GNA-3 g alpha subunit GNA-3 [Fusarium subglutinans]KAF5611414.1 GNA-3 g alpha subunit GNA-3 [Fusarium subglutinans]